MRACECVCVCVCVYMCVCVCTCTLVHLGLSLHTPLRTKATRPFSCPEAAWYNLLASGICLGGFLLSPIVLPYHRDLSLHMFE